MIITRFDATGRYLSTAQASEDSLKLEDEQRIYIGHADSKTQYHDLATNLPVAKPPRPSAHHVFDYSTKQWLDPRTAQDHLAATRARRNALLAASDWTQLPDVPRKTRAAWAAYRQALRDITAQPDPHQPQWPAPP